MFFVDLMVSLMTVPGSPLKDNARRFLEVVKATLNAELPPPDELRSAVLEIASAPKADSSKERAFLNHFVVPNIFSVMQMLDGIGPIQAREAFLCEGYARLSQYCSGTPSRTEGHPFTKIINSNASEIMSKWKGGRGKPLTQACPDFAFRYPFPFKIVFEAKYFEHGSADKAARDLAADIYQAFFYRSLPYVPPKRSGVAWDYDFACLLSYDASPDGAMLNAWDTLAESVKAGFWEGANVYVMILSGDRPSI
jgi:hypothetical protein